MFRLNAAIKEGDFKRAGFNTSDVSVESANQYLHKGKRVCFNTSDVSVEFMKKEGMTYI